MSVTERIRWRAVPPPSVFTAEPDQHSQRPSYGLIRPWRSTLNTQFQFEEIMFALAGRRLTGNVGQKMKTQVLIAAVLVFLAVLMAASEPGPFSTDTGAISRSD